MLTATSTGFFFFFAPSVAATRDTPHGIFTLAGQCSIAGALTWVVVVGALVSLLGYGATRR